MIRFAGDSGTGCGPPVAASRPSGALRQRPGDLADFPAEIRAPAGSLPGVSGFQLHFADHDILTPGDQPDVLVAMNPAALKTNLADLPKGGVLIADADTFTDRNLKKAGYDANPLQDGSLDAYQVHAVPSTSMTTARCRISTGDGARGGALEEHVRARADVVALWSADGDDDRVSRGEIRQAAEIVAANVKAFQTGYAFGETSESFAVHYEVKPARLEPGRYRQITGNQALSYGLLAASKLSGLRLFLGAYPITPASGILEELARQKAFGVRAFQAEDEIAAVGAALGASFGGRARRSRHRPVRASC